MFARTFYLRVQKGMIALVARAAPCRGPVQVFKGILNGVVDWVQYDYGRKLVI